MYPLTRQSKSAVVGGNNGRQQGARYVYSPKHINNILDKIKDTGRPEKLNLQYVKDTWLLKDNNLAAVLVLLDDMQFLDPAGVPTDRYAAFQNISISKSVLAEGIRTAYSDLFKAYPSANSKDKKFLEGYFKQKTGAENSVLDKIVNTFSTLCSLADFTTQAPGSLAAPPQPQGAPHTQETVLPITMNIQIVVPSDATEEQYDKIFSSIRKFLTK